MKLGKKEIVETLVADGKFESKKAAEEAVKAVLDAITDNVVAGNEVSFVGFGTFAVRERAAKDGINPLTKEPLHIEAKKVPVFKAGKPFKDAVNK